MLLFAEVVFQLLHETIFRDVEIAKARMTREYDSHSLKRRVLFFLVVYLSISFSIVASVGIYPLYTHFREAAENTLITAVDARGIAVREHLAQMTQVALQTSYKTGTRTLQERLLDGKTSPDEFDREIRPRLINAMEISGEISGITKFDLDRNIILNVGIPKLQTFCPPIRVFTPSLHFCGPFSIDSETFLTLVVPLKRGNSTPLGWDVFYFTTELLLQTITSSEKTTPISFFIVGEESQAETLILSPHPKNNVVETLIADKMLGKEKEADNRLIRVETESGVSFIATSFPLPDTSWTLVGKIEEGLLYHTPLKQFELILLVTISLIALGIAGMILLFRPIAGRVFIYSDELERLNLDLRNESEEHWHARENLQSALAHAEEARARINAILKSVPDPLIVLDRKKNLFLMNTSAEDLLRVRAEEVTGRPFKDQPICGEMAETLGKILEEEGDHTEEIAWPNPSGKNTKIYQVRHASVGETLKSPEGTILLLRDITRQKEMDRLKTDFISTAAHELRTPLATMMGFSELLLEGGYFTLEQKTEFLSYIFHKTEDLAHIVDDLLDITRIESGKGLSFKKEPLIFGELLKECVLPYRKRYPSYKFELELDSSPILFVDRIKIVEVLENLLSNAVKYSHEGDTIVISGIVEEGFYRVTVTDHGIGMTSEVAERIFEKFFRADSSDTAKKGIGLGMFIVKHVIEGHGGKIWVESRLGEGTSIHFTLPIEADIG